MTKEEAELVYEGMRTLLKKALDGSRLGASQEYMEKWLGELDTLMMYALAEAVRAGPMPYSALHPPQTH